MRSLALGLMVLVGCDDGGQRPLDEGAEEGAVVQPDGATDGAVGADAAADLGPPCTPGRDDCSPGDVCTTLARCATPHPPSVATLVARRGDGVIFLNGEVADAERDAETLHMTLGDAQQAWPLSLTVAPTVPVARLWFTPSPAAEAVVWATDRSGLESPRVTIAVEEIPVVEVGSACDPEGLQSRCTLGALCLERAGAGRCFAGQTHLWPWNGNVLVDITTDAELDWQAGTVTIGEQFVSNWWPEDRLTWRWTGYLGAFEGPAEVRHRGHLLTTAAVEPLPIRANGATCDAERLADACMAGTACLDARCEPVEAPTLEAVTAVWQDGVLGFTATGRDPDGDLVGFTVDRLEDRFQVDRDGRRSGAVIWNGDRFVAWWSGPMAVRPARVRIEVVDAEALHSAALDVEVADGAPEWATEAGLCDTSGLLFRCAADRTCTRTEADPEARCRLPDAACPDALPLVDQVAGTLESGTDHTTVTCGEGWGPDALYRFTPPRTGRYRFTLDSTSNAYLALRASCTQHAELACTDSWRQGGAVLEVDLTANAPVTAVVESAICRCNPGPYTLQVEAL